MERSAGAIHHVHSNSLLYRILKHWRVSSGIFHINSYLDDILMRTFLIGREALVRKELQEFGGELP
jgi:hypothetical protein